MSKKAVLALDLGTTCGWAYDYLGTTLSGVWDLRPGRYSGAGMRFVRFIAKLDELQGVQPLESIYFEEVRAHKGVDAAHVYGGLMATLQTWAEKAEPPIPYEGVSVGAIKKFATGKGNAPKEAMIRAVEGWGFAPVDDNEADALALLLYVTKGGGA